ncbi:cytochrome P450 [Gordonia aquimaris]|uniref:Cytochrome P450 n=1 Tax=Gordonia aquimaris TaxID=2984863 RepID=A0A9X3I3I1_9ACTN|nr:cytochrome P450 [Gordonia aquimaris]MCX2963191.1 cytochrome P450 [Gordonia aquimaris]
MPRTRDHLPWTDPQLRRDPYPFYAHAQTHAPVSRDEDGTVVLTKYADLMHYGRLPSVLIAPEWDKAGAWSVLSDMALGHDEPDHTRLKRLTSNWFTPKRVRQWVAITASVTDEILDRIGADGLIDGSSLAVEATHRTICRVLQVTEDGFDDVRHYMRMAMPVLSAAAGPEDFEACEQAHVYLQGRVRELLEHARENPGDGLIHELVETEQRGEITAAETLATALFFYTVGHMDASYLISSGLQLFAEQPAVFDAFRTNPDVRQNIVSELVRYDAPEPVVTRATSEDLDIGGFEVPAGSTLRLMLGAANRDPDVYDDPQKFDYTRPPAQSRSLTFSLGSHSCQGRLLAEAEIKTVWERIALRYSQIKVASAPEMMLTDASRHFITQPLRFT